jgi:peptide/nickel transport system substrate-binding protein
MDKNKPISRRRFVAGAGLALAATGAKGLLLPRKAWAQAVRRGGTVSLSIQAPVYELDPHKVVSQENYPATFHIYSALTRIGRDFNAEPELAKSWSTDDGGETWTFNLFENAKFHSGRPVTAEDVKFSLERVLDEKTSPRGFSAIGPIKEVIAKDRHTVVIRLSTTYVDLPVDLGGIYPRIVDRETVDNIATAPNGSGPFKMATWEPTGNTVLTANKDYHIMGQDGRPIPYIDTVRIVPIKEPTSEFAALQSGAIDVMQTLPFDLISTAQDDSKLVVDASASGYHSLSLHQNPTFRLPNDNSELLKDKRVRQALAYAINRPAILNLAISGFGTVGNDQPIPPTHVYGHAGLAPRRHDIEKGKRLLAEAGVKPGTRMILHTTTGRPGLMEFGLAVREMAKAIGLDIAVDAIDISRYWTDIEYRAPMYTDNWGARQTINASIKPFFETNGGNNTAGYSDPALDKVLTQAESEPDFETRKALYNEAMEMVSEAAVTIIPYFKGFYIAMNKAIGGVSAHPMTYMWLDRAHRKT